MRRYFAPIEKQAESLLDQHGLLKAHIDVDQLAESLGLVIEYTDLHHRNHQDWLSGALILQNGKGVIAINENDSAERKRFTIAHEIGHFILHNRHNEAYLDRSEPTMFYRSQQTNQFEREANVFAASLLMPNTLIYGFIAHIDVWEIEDKIEELAKTFKVSDIAMTYRLTNLGYLS